MASTTSPSRPTIDDPAPAGIRRSSPLPPLPRQRRRGLLALAVLLIVLGGLGALYLVTTLTDRTPVIVMARDVPVGQMFTEQDLTTAMLAADDTVAHMPGNQMGQVVGKVAAVDLAAGTLLPPTAVTTAQSPTAGQHLVALAVKPSQVPARGLRPGDQVVVVLTPAEEQQPSGANGAAPRSIPAVVSQVAGPNTDGFMVIDLVVREDDGPRLAVAAAGGHIALNVTPRGT
ncbi:SAF domain-containing protein (plasmid) [Nonomuraea sp. NBC_00507]|uniref:SAF domain-containing protein n=1 Tax=Nonomuraea sp. NBC_00507 TaxID=2976002 RepID=UPI002E1865FF